MNKLTSGVPDQYNAKKSKEYRALSNRAHVVATVYHK